MRFIFLIITSLMAMTVFGQDAHILGHVSDEQGECMRYVTIKLKGTSIGTISDETGHYFLKDIPVGQQTVVFSYMGYITEERTVNLKKDQMLELNIKMREESFLVDNVVVTANKYQTKSKEAASIVNVVSPVLFEMTNAHSMADVLNYQTGLRVEQTCSNCGLPQLRINGLEGQYSQILMDSRPIFSSRASVYGLEQIPAGMVDRVEIIRGGGSA
ncbi:MAG: TonB-dependent receptor, partial [Bacteroidaceae bacterium]|nr:TonB-dependent receptor [Bacteroidaceae bacterium]